MNSKAAKIQGITYVGTPSSIQKESWVVCLLGYLLACLFALQWWRISTTGLNTALLTSKSAEVVIWMRNKMFQKQTLGTTQWSLMCCLPSSVHFWNSEKLIRFFSSKELTQHFYMKVPTEPRKSSFVEVGECSAQVTWLLLSIGSFWETERFSILAAWWHHLENGTMNGPQHSGLDNQVPWLAPHQQHVSKAPRWF